MKLDKKLKESYNKQVSKPEDYQNLANNLNIKKTHHTFFRTLKISGLVAASLVGTFVLVVAGSFLISSIQTVDNFKSVKKARFSIYDTNLVKSATFKSLNNIEYTEEMENRTINENFVNSLNSFASNSFSKMEKNNNIAYSPLMFYTQLDLISCAVSDEETATQFDDALLINNASERQTNIYNAMRNNFFVNAQNKNTVQAKNAVFVHSEFGANEQFVNDMSVRNTEIYEMDFQNSQDVNKAVDWINQSVNEPGFIDSNYLEIKEDSALLFASTLYFDNSWSHKFKTEDTKEDDFYLADGTTIKTKFMNHVTYTHVNEYDEYISTYDNYSSGYSIQYFVPKDINDNIFNLLPSNFLDVSNEKNEDYAMVSLSLPKMELTCSSKLTDVAKDLGITNPYVFHSNHLKNAFRDGELLEYSYLNYSKQKTSISFSEDGTVVKSLTMTMGAAGKAAEPHRDGYKIELNQPFVYCIRDRSGLPLILGAVTNPTK